MAQLYFLAIFVNLIGGIYFANDFLATKFPKVVKVVEFFENSTSKFVFAVMAGITGLFKIISVSYGDVPVIGDLLIAATSIAIAESSPYLRQQYNYNTGEIDWIIDGKKVVVDELMLKMISSLSDAQLKEQFKAIRNELASRGLTSEKSTVILDQNGVKLYINDAPTITKSWDNKHYLNIPMVIINDSGKSIAVVPEEGSVNGWKAECDLSDRNVPIGKKSKVNLQFLLDDTDVEKIEDFEDFELWFKVYDNDDWFGKKVIEKSKIITVYASQIH